jgi:hypothetical protein
MPQRVTVRERIDPAITASLFANYRSSADAVMELVDNSIDSRIKGRQLESFFRFILRPLLSKLGVGRGWGRPSSSATSCWRSSFGLVAARPDHLRQQPSCP